ncbi:uncharacterized protein BO80DRAFT_112509 [Aspergillus ibericus CBS 121593]|uniref:Uncharacterized protein n=1 Tax=Aspergillus ibericus CBS 121593 TaxID=1448316 RepID=A0A395GX95_9EURO|nr:hypothetical protein BO80DRAFT_112509 [Aspergillus ibericus CBS 121593]RAL00043.1 hypothetical protein BO80DRAFT_112509 [Aspergillus ibericus CBS 121593]
MVGSAVLVISLRIPVVIPGRGSGLNSSCIRAEGAGKLVAASGERANHRDQLPIRAFRGKVRGQGHLVSSNCCHSLSNSLSTSSLAHDVTTWWVGWSF